MDVSLHVSNQRGNVIIKLFKDAQSPNSYKEFVFSVQRAEKESRYLVSASSSEIQDIFETLKTIRIVPFKPGGIGLDGESYRLSFSDGITSSSFAWWMSPPEGWEGLVHLVTLLLSLGERYTHEHLR